VQKFLYIHLRNCKFTYDSNLFSESAGLDRLGMVGEEVNEELSLMELLLMMSGDEKDVFGPVICLDLPPTTISDIFGGKTVTVPPTGDSKFGVRSVHLQPFAVHLW
jgi:hypothetical protein